MERSTRPEASKADIKRVRSLLRDRSARDDAGLFVCEGPRVIAAALEHGAELVECFVGTEASPAITAVADAVEATGVPVLTFTAKLGDAVTPQPIFAVARLERRRADALAGMDLVAVAVAVNDPGNAGTLVRSAAAAGADGIVLGAGSVDAYNPKTVRASAGACFAVRIVEGVPAVEILDALGTAGVRRLGAVAQGGDPPERIDLTVPTAFVLGHETRGLGADLPLDGLVTIPMAAGESVNVAMAGTALLFEAARQRRIS